MFSLSETVANIAFVLGIGFVVYTVCWGGKSQPPAGDGKR